MGGLGNQLFQIFATISYAISNKQKFVFLNTDMLGRRHTYWTTFLKSLAIFTTTKGLNSPNMLRENGFAYSALPKPVSQDTIIYGYFQSEKYFKENYQMIKRLIKVEDQRVALREKLGIETWHNTVSLHFRLGDYKGLQDKHPVLKPDYYLAALKRLSLSSPTIYYFCEKEDNMVIEKVIRWLSSEFLDARFIKADDRLADWEQMLFMSLCENNIIANSSFSWWGAYFNTNPEKKVIYPSTWFGPMLAMNDTRDLVPEEWIKC